ncbi:MAG: DUF5721 family protein [Eubacteriales bacterium]
MIALQITEVKQFMNKLLNSDCFDSFLLEEATISTYNNFIIDGHQNKEFYTKEELEDPEIFSYEFSKWSTVRPICLSLVKGKKTPTYFKFVLNLMPEHVYSTLEKGNLSSFNTQIKTFVLTIKFDSNGLLLTTGTSFSSFVLDKSPDALWDTTIKNFLLGKQISFEEL